MELKFSVWVEAPHDMVWNKLKEQIEHPKTKDGKVKSVEVVERKKNFLKRQIKPKRGRLFEEEITFFPAPVRKTISKMSRGPFESISQEVAKEKGRTKITMEFRPRRVTRWILKLKQWVKRAPLDLDDVLNLAAMPKISGAKKD